MALSFAPLLVGELIGREVAFKAVSDTSTKIYDLMRGLVIEEEYPEISEVLTKLDIQTTLAIIDPLLNEISNKKNISSESDYLEESNTENNKHLALDRSFYALKDIITQIHDLLQQIKDVISNHKQKYFFYWRTPVFLPLLKLLELKKDILDQRFNLFMRLLTICES